MSLRITQFSQVSLLNTIQKVISELNRSTNSEVFYLNNFILNTNISLYKTLIVCFKLELKWCKSLVCWVRETILYSMFAECLGWIFGVQRVIRWASCSREEVEKKSRTSRFFSASSVVWLYLSCFRFLSAFQLFITWYSFIRSLWMVGWLVGKGKAGKSLKVQGAGSSPPGQESALTHSLIAKFC